MDSQSIKAFFMKHIEKIILGAIGAFALFLIYQGTGYPMFKDTQLKPNELQEKAQSVKTSIDDPHNEQVLAMLPAEEPKTYQQRIAQLQRRIPFDEYPHVALEIRPIDESIKRTDPLLLAPIDLRMTGVLAAMAVQGRRQTSYPARDLEDAELPEEEEDQPTRRERRNSRRGPTADYMSMDDPSMMMADPMMMMEEGAGMPGMPGGVRRLDPKYNLGIKAVNAAPTMGGAAGPGGGPDPDARKPLLKTVPESAFFIAGRAALPHKELVEAFKLTFEKTRDYKAVRDRPIYLGYDVQRADVTQKSVDELADADWVNVDGWDRMNLYALSWWDGYAPDVVPADYRDPKLTALIPPLLIYDFTHFATHPKIPMKTMVELAQEEMDPMDTRQLPDIFDPNAKQVPLTRSQPGMPGTRAEMGMGMGSSTMGAEKNPAEFKLVRFYDFYHPQFQNPPRPGHDYVYRIRVKLEDPNFPENPMLSPSLRSLSPEVFARVVPKIKEAETSKKRDFELTTPWSEPSEVVSLPRLTSMYAGPIVEAAQTKEVQIENRNIEYVRSTATAKAVATYWDWKYALAIPAPMEILPGTLLNATLDAEVVDPLTLSIKTKPNSAAQTNSVVLDIAGGEALQLEVEDKLTRPGLVLVFDPVDGGLKVLEEIDDKFQYNMYTFTEEKAEPLPADSMMPGADYMGSDYMQMEPPARGKR